MRLENRVFKRSLQSLSHPLTIGMVLLLLLNDRLLRRTWPSWWTGKLGDLAWLLFFPLMLVAVLSWVIPARTKRLEDVVAGLAFLLTGVVFALMNSVPKAHAAGIRLIETVTVRPAALYIDPTDLVVLPTLMAGWAIWQQSDKQIKQLPPQGWMVLVLGTLATIANVPAAPGGIDCLSQEEDGTLLAISTWEGIYASQDGGLTWTFQTDELLEQEALEELGCTFPAYSMPSWELSALGDGQVWYRFTPGEMIERSEDGGQTWSQDIDVSLSQAERSYYENVRGLFYFEPGPLDALVHQPTGHVVAAMGYEGVLTRTADGNWHWISVGLNEHEELKLATHSPTLLEVELLLACAVSFLTTGTLAFQLGESKPITYLLALVAWGGWGMMVIYSPALQFPTFDKGLVLAYFFPLVSLAILVWGIAGFRRFHRRFYRLPKEVWMTAISAALLFALPYVLWSLAVIPLYGLAALSALMLVTATIYAGLRYLMRILGS